MKKTYIAKLIFIVLCFTLFTFIFLLNQNKVEAASTSTDINGINESKYPGYKSALQKIKAQHPNWTIKLYYTGIDWDKAVNSENTGHGASPKSLVYKTYDKSWYCILDSCKNRTYDVSGNWYCASKQAIAYMMDARNSLTEEYLFQFQDLGSSAGEESEIRQMTKNTFLSDDESIKAIMSAAKKWNISPFHIVSRIIQEQSSAGTGRMNGYVYTTPEGEKVLVYNLFNIKVSGNDESGYEAGAAYAYEQGWTTKVKAIEGGAEFLREDYLNKGQTTLYFQKFNVVDQSNLFEHQYMQNITAVYTEGNKNYQAYKTSGILDSHFEFIIPIYEKMPSTISPQPRFIGVSDVQFKQNEYISYVGDAVDIPYTYTPAESMNAEFYWTSSNDSIIRVWGNRFRALQEGTADVIVRTTDGKFEKRIKVTVRKAIFVKEMKFEKSEYTAKVDEAVDLKYTITPSDSTNADFYWTSSNDTIIRVWGPRFRALKPGTADVIAKTEDGRFEKRVKVTVTAGTTNVPEIKFEKVEYTAKVDEAVDLKYTATNIPESQIYWTSSNDTIIRVWGPRFRALKPGTANVIAQTLDGKYKTQVKVTVTANSANIPEIKIEKQEYTAKVDEAVDLKYTATNIPDSQIYWTSSNDTIIRVWGPRFRALKPGTANVIAQTLDGKYKTQVKVTVSGDGD